MFMSLAQAKPDDSLEMADTIPAKISEVKVSNLYSVRVCPTQAHVQPYIHNIGAIYSIVHNCTPLIRQETHGIARF